MPNYCTQCGIQIYYEAEICNDCVTRPQTQNRPVAQQTREQYDFSQYQTQPLDPPNFTQQMQPFAAQPNLQKNFSQCPYCGGAGGITTKSVITTGGFVYMGIMFTLTFFLFLTFFPCAIIPFFLFFLGLLFKETHFVCVNCGQKIS